MIEIPNVSEFITNQKAIERLENCIKNLKPCLLVGKAGVGKTSSVYAVAKKLNLHVYEINASDERNEETLLQIKSRTKARHIDGKMILFLIDEADGIRDIGLLKKIIEESKNPVVLTANEGWKLEKINGLEIINYKTPFPDDVKKRLTELFGDVEQKISGDVRSSIIATEVGSENYSRNDYHIIVENIFLRGIVPERIDRRIVIWILDNITNFYFGSNVRKAFKLLSVADLCKYRAEVFSCFPKPDKRGRAEYPFLLRRASVDRA